jgi:hypothetical protein
MVNYFSIDVVTNLDLSFSLDWDCPYLPRVGECISFVTLINKAEVPEEKRHILEENTFKVVYLEWRGDLNVFIYVEKSGDIKTLTLEEYTEYLRKQGILVVV